MTLERIQLWTYLLEVREVSEVVLWRLSEVRDASDRWVRVKDSEDAELQSYDIGAGLDEAVFQSALRERQQLQFQYFAALEAFLAGWARLSLLLFPLEGKGPDAASRAARGRAIRDELGIAASTILADRELRDAWMHFDERLDRALFGGTFGERYRFVRSTKANQLIQSTIILLEVDSLVVHYTTRSGSRASMDLNRLEQAVSEVRESLKGTVAG